MPTRITNYAVRDGQGQPVAEHVRIDYEDGHKTFAWRRNGEYGLGGLALAELPLYGSERLAGWEPGSRVYLVEGEKACEALLEAGLQAVGTVTGPAPPPAMRRWGRCGASRWRCGRTTTPWASSTWSASRCGWR